MLQLPPAALIVGCGYVGRFLAARLLARHIRVFGLVRSEASARTLATMGVQPLIASITQRLELTAALKPVLEQPQVDVYYLVPPGRPQGESGAGGAREVVLDGPRHLLSLLQRGRTSSGDASDNAAPSNIRRYVIASSTAIYGQTQGEHVDADTPAVANDERSQLLIDGEQVWLTSEPRAHVVRLAGLYGPGRIIGMQAVRDGAPLVGDPQAWLNLIHGDDAAALMIQMMMSPRSGRIELGSDGSPVRRMEYYTTLARCIGAPPPRVLDAAQAAGELGLPVERLKRASSKQCDNVATCQRTGWLPQYPHFRDGLVASFAAMRT